MKIALATRARAKTAATLVVTLAIGLVAVPGAGAEVFTVTRNDDPPPGACLPADCSLREAVAASNASTTVDDKIVVPASPTPYAVDLEVLKLNDTVEIRGAGAGKSILDGDGNNQIIENRSPGVVISDLAITGGEGGIQNQDELTLRRVSVDHNIRPNAGGGIQNNAPLFVDSSFIGFNKGSGTAGGGIQSNDPVTILDSTFVGNTSDGSSAIASNAALTITSSAIVGNISSSTTSGALGAISLTVRDSIFAANTNSTGTHNCVGPVTSLGGNVDDTAGCAVGPGDRPNVNPGLGSLDLHGGTTLVHSLLPGSPAIDFAGACPALDQRGTPRPLGAACDSGPYEFEPVAAVPPPGDRELAMSLGKGRLMLSKKGETHVKLTCPSTEASPPCSGRVALKYLPPIGKKVGAGTRKSLSLASAPFTIRAGKTATLALKLPPARAELVRSRKAGLPVLVEVNAKDSAGNRQRLRKPRRLTPRKL